MDHFNNKLIKKCLTSRESSRIDMKTFLFFVLMILGLNAYSQTAKDSTRILDYIQISRSDETKWIQRFQKSIDAYIDQNRKLEDKSCDVLIFGSSSINMWNNIYEDLAPLTVIRRSYGGATIRDMIYNYDIIARGYHPKSIVLYVENDIVADISVGDIYDLFRVFTAKIRRDYPDTPFYILSIKPSPSRESLLKRTVMLNSLLEDYANTAKNVHYIDITQGMYDNVGNIRKDIFLDDMLHMNSAGYDLWIKVLKPVLMQNK